MFAMQEHLKAILVQINKLNGLDSEEAQGGDFDEQFEHLHEEM